MTKVPKNTFYHILNTAEPGYNGKFSFQKLSGDVSYELEYNDGNLTSVGLMNARNKNVRLNQTCIDWYLVTTYYNSWGQPIGYTETFVGTTCYEEGGGGGGGDTPPEGEDPDAEYAIRKTVDWVVHVISPASGGGIVSVERFIGKRVSGEPQGGHFKGVNHYWSICNVCNGSSNPYDIWLESSCAATASGQSAMVTISGNLTYNHVGQVIENTKSWSFSSVFP